MNLRTAALIVLFLTILSANSVSATAAGQWISVRSANFRLAGNADEKDIRRVAEKLEQFRLVFTQLFTEIKFNSPIPTTVIVFKDENSFKNFKPLDENGAPKDWVKGFFQPDSDVNYIALTAVSDEQGDYTTIFHEYVHFLINNTLGKANVPPWLNEGLAEYYEQFQIDASRRATLGSVNKSHLLTLQKNGLMPFEKFLSVDDYTLKRQSADFAVPFYAQSWALVHYLIHFRKVSLNKQITDFSNRLKAGKNSRDAFQEAFQIDYAATEKDLKQYITRKNFEFSTVSVNYQLPSASEMQTSPLSEAEAEAFQGDLLFHSNRLPEAEVKLENALRLDSDLGFANISMGLVKSSEKKFDQAKKYLAKGIASEPGNYFAFYSYASVLSREKMTDYGFVAGYDVETAEQIRENLRKAIKLNPEFAESYQLFSFIDSARNENLDEGIEMIGRALKIAPGNQMYNLRLAELYTRQQNFVEARKIIEKILRSASDEQFRFYVLNNLSRIDAWENQLRETDEAKKHPDAPEPEQKLLTEEEIRKLNEQALLESLNQALRRPKADEQRIAGFLLKVACEPSKIVFTVKSGEKTLHFESPTLADVALMSFTSTLVHAQFGCNSAPNANFAVITFRPNKDANSPSGGNISAVEFVPENFVFLDLSKIVNRTKF